MPAMVVQAEACAQTLKKRRRSWEALVNLHDDMEMICHQTIRDEIKFTYLVCAIQSVEKSPAIFIVEEHVGLVHATVCYVIEAGF